MESGKEDQGSSKDNAVAASTSEVPSKDDKTAVSAPNSPNTAHSFSVFTWLKLDRGDPRIAVAQAELTRVDKFLRENTRTRDQLAYTECPEATHEELRSILTHLAIERKILDMDDSAKVRVALEDRIDIFNAAIIIFEYFLPLQFSGPTVGKFWGSLKVLLDVRAFASHLPKVLMLTVGRPAATLA